MEICYVMSTKYFYEVLKIVCSYGTLNLNNVKVAFLW